MQRNNKTILYNTFFLYSQMGLSLLISLYTTRVVLQVLGIVDYGIFNVVAGFVSMFAFLNTSMNSSTQRYYNYYKGKEDQVGLQKVYTTSLLIQFCIAFLIIFILETFGVWYINNKMVLPTYRLEATNYVFQFSAWSLLFVILQIPYSASIIAHEKMFYFSLVNIFDVLLKLFTVLILPHVPYDKLIFYGAFTFCVSIADFLLYYIYSKRRFKELRINKKVDNSMFKSMLSFSGWNVFEAIAYVLQGQGLNVLMNSFFGPIVNAARGISFQIHGAVHAFSYNVGMAFKPQITESYAQSNFDRTKSLFYSLSKISYIMLFIISAPIVIELDFLLKIWLGDSIPEYTSIFTILVIANMIIGSINMPISQTVQATGKIKYYQIIRSIVVVLTLPLSWITLLCDANPAIVFWVTMFVTIINQPVSLIILHSVFIYSYREYIKRVLVPCALFTVIMPIIPIFIHQTLSNSVIRFFSVGLSVILTSIVICYFVVLTKDERKNIIVKFQRKKYV